MKKLNIGRVILFLIGCAVIGIFINFVIVKNTFDLQGFVYFSMIALSVAACGLTVYLLTFLIIREDRRKSSEDNSIIFTANSGGDGAGNLVNRIDGYLTEIQLLNDYIKDGFISDELFEIEKSIRKIQAQLKDETISVKRTEQLKEFFEYYMPLIVKILNSYRRIEKNELKGKNATETKKQISAILPVIKKAFEKELDYMFTDEMLDITTDVQMLESMLAKDGLLDDRK